MRNPDAFEGYLRRTIVNPPKNDFRHRAVERSYLARHAGQVVEGRTDPDVPTYETIRAALLARPVRQRAAIGLRYYEDLPEGQIAEILGCRPATVRSLVARGIEALRQIPEVLTWTVTSTFAVPRPHGRRARLRLGRSGARARARLPPARSTTSVLGLAGVTLWRRSSWSARTSSRRRPHPLRGRGRDRRTSPQTRASWLATDDAPDGRRPCVRVFTRVHAGGRGTTEPCSTAIELDVQRRVQRHRTVPHGPGRGELRPRRVGCWSPSVGGPPARGFDRLTIVHPDLRCRPGGPCAGGGCPTRP